MLSESQRPHAAPCTSCGCLQRAGPHRDVAVEHPRVSEAQEALGSFGPEVIPPLGGHWSQKRFWPKCAPPPALRCRGARACCGFAAVAPCEVSRPGEKETGDVLIHPVCGKTSGSASADGTL